MLTLNYRCVVGQTAQNYCLQFTLNTAFQTVFHFKVSLISRLLVKLVMVNNHILLLFA